MVVEATGRFISSSISWKVLLNLVLFKLQCRKCPWTGWSFLPFNQTGDLFSASANPICSYLFNIVSTLHNYTNNYCLNLQMWPNTVETTRTNLTCLEYSRDIRLIRSMRTVCWTIILTTVRRWWRWAAVSSRWMDWPENCSQCLRERGADWWLWRWVVHLM